MKVICRTNLDLNYENWPDELPEVPRVGDLIESSTKHGNFRLKLQVVSVTWRYDSCSTLLKNKWIPEIELHMTDFQRKLPSTRKGAADGSLYAFYEWYARCTGTSVSNYI